MRMTNLYMPTLRETPADAESTSQRLLLRAGMIRRAHAGLYSLLPLGLRARQKIERIVRKEWEKAGLQEVQMPLLQDRDSFEESDRWELCAPEMFRLRDRQRREFALAKSSAEQITALIHGEITSYKQLPVALYQVQKKHTDAESVGAGFAGAREAVLAEAYRFDRDETAAKEAAGTLRAAFENIMEALSLQGKGAVAAAGSLRASEAESFVAFADTGDAHIAFCDASGYAAEAARARVALDLPATQTDEKPELLHTPEVKTIEDLATFAQVKPEDMCKAIDLMVQGKPIFVFVPGHRELSMEKLVDYLGVQEYDIEMMDEYTVEELTGAEAGFTGPVGIQKGARLIADSRLQNRVLLTGANKTDYHLKNVMMGRDFEAEIAVDLLMPEEGDRCPDCEHALAFARGIEIGRAAQLGTQYAEAFDAKYLDEDGAATFLSMGTYQVELDRCLAAVVEQHSDDAGIVWPMSVAPFQAIVTLPGMRDEATVRAAEELYEELKAEGVEVLLDDRNERAGVKFNDRDLIGIPLRITVGKKIGDGLVECSSRADLENRDLTIEDAKKWVLEETASYR